MPLNVKQVDKLIREAKPGGTADGYGLYLRITTTGNASWQYRYQLQGNRRTMGLGACTSVTLADARSKAAEAMALVKSGKDPLNEREAQALQVAKKTTTFKDVADEYIASHRHGWKNIKHAQQWENTLAHYVHPLLGAKQVDTITTNDVLAVLKPIWQTKAETAARIRSRIELVIDAARAHSLSEAPNPARWKGHLDKLLPKRNKASKGHHAALDYQQMPDFYQRLTEERDSLSATALAITILTACRTSEVLFAQWEEIDLTGKIWVIPAKRMKAGNEHRIPLSDKVLSLLERLPTREGYLFPGAKHGKPLSNMAMTMVLRKLGRHDLTVHGFRSTFRDWAAETTHYQNIVCEMALAHTITNAAEAAYRRGDLMERRRMLMIDWANYISTPSQIKSAQDPMPHTSKIV
jgi:integrase